MYVCINDFQAKTAYNFKLLCDLFYCNLCFFDVFEIHDNLKKKYFVIA